MCEKCKIDVKALIRGFCKRCYYHLKRHGELFNLEKPEINSFSLIQEELLIGSLLGDANLSRNATSKFAHLKIERSSKDFEYLQYQFEILKSFCKSDCKEYIRKDGKSACYFITRSYEILDTLYNKWYPNGVKIVPHDIILTPFIIAIWLCDDGNISLHHKKYGLLRTNFATNDFTKEDVEWLAKQLSNRYKENFHISKTSIDGQYVINGADAATRAMLKDINDVFPKVMSRKLIVVEENPDRVRIKRIRK